MWFVPLEHQDDDGPGIGLHVERRDTAPALGTADGTHVAANDEWVLTADWATDDPDWHRRRSRPPT